MKKWIILLLVFVVGGGGIWVYRNIRAAGEEADRAYEVEEMTDADISSGLKSQDLRKRLDAVAQLSKLTPAQRKAALLDALEAAAAPARLTAVTALGDGFGTDGDVVAALLTVAKTDPDTDVKEAAFSVLTKSGDPRVLSVAAEVLIATDASLAMKVSAAKTLDRLTGRETAAALETAFDSAEEAADDIGMDWDDWIGENADGLKWNAESGRFE